MLRIESYRPSIALLVAIGLGAIGSAAADWPWAKKKAPDAPIKKMNPKYDYPVVGDDTGIDGLTPIKVEGLGLVVGLGDQGGDPPPNEFREAMLAEMRRKEVANPEALLARTDNCIVLLRAFIPPGARKEEPIDVEVWIPPGDPSKSLKGGRLLEAELKDVLEFSTRKGAVGTKKGKTRVKVEGPVLVLDAGDGNAAALRKGKVLGRGQVLEDRGFRIVLSKEAKSIPRTRNMTHQINQRFYTTLDARREGVAKGKSDQLIDLKLARVYAHDIPRYLQVVRRIPMNSSETFLQRAMEDLESELNDPASSLEASLRLEAIGKPAAPILRKALTSGSEPVRFCAAMSLAYMEDAAGAKVLGRLAEGSLDYRPYALSGLLASNRALARVELIKLVSAVSPEARYGAFRALLMFDRRDAFIQGEFLERQFHLHVMPTSAEPMVHVARHFRPEIVVFGPDMTLQAPFSLKAGDGLLINATANSDKVHLASFRTAGRKVDTMRGTSSMKLTDVIREASKLGATYPDIVAMLEQARANGALSARLEVNALPRMLPLEDIQALAADTKGQGERGRLRREGNTNAGLFAVVEGERRPVAAEESSESKPRKDGDELADAEKKKKPFWKSLFPVGN
jgi:flagellar basal body P-ring protein FlgI